ncbi:MAG: hypothetical protein KC620_23240, partial [Myxococcales bacterium]|nr:hypothetical protein [Myxococcales bacterium]
MSDKLRFGEILVRAGVLDRETLDRVLREIGDSPADLGEVLVTRKLVDESTMLHAVGKALNLPSVSVEQATPDPRALQLVPRQLCAEYFLLPIEVERSRMGEHLHVAMANPADVRAIKQVTRQSRLRIRPLVASAREIRVAIARCYGEEAAPVAAEPAPSPPEIPVAPPSRASGAGTDHIFDFDVTDLSAYHDDPPTTPGGTNPELRAAPSGVDLSVGLPPAGLTSRHSTPALGSATSRHSTGSLNPVASRHSTPSLSVPNKTPPPPASSRTSRPPIGPLDAPAPRTL